MPTCWPPRPPPTPRSPSAGPAIRRAPRPPAERRAGDLAAQAEDPVTPALQGVETRAVLTPAERETAVLAANGRANKEIAEQLHLSPRTVENRLQRVYDKLGISGRGELGEVLDKAG